MKKLTCVFFAAILSLAIISCGSDDSDNDNDTGGEGMDPVNIIVGKWQLIQDFTNDGSGGPLQEVELTNCEKGSTIEIDENGSFVDTSIEDGLDGGECETFIENGTWEETGDAEYRLTFDETSVEEGDAAFGDAEIDNSQLILIYDFPSSNGGPNIIDKLIYTKVE